MPFCLSMLAAGVSETAGSGFGFGAALLKTLAALAIVCGLAYLLLRFGLQRMMRGTGRSKHLRIVDQCALGSSQGLWLVEAGSRLLLIGVAERALTVISELDRSDVYPDQQPATESTGPGQRSQGQAQGRGSAGNQDEQR